MPVDVGRECLPAYRELFAWHTAKIRELAAARAAEADEGARRRIGVVEARMLAERRRIMRIYPGEFPDDGLGAPAGV